MPSLLGCYHHELGIQNLTLSLPPSFPQALGSICNQSFFPKLVKRLPLAVAIAAQIG